jgi:hypothetical protein
MVVLGSPHFSLAEFRQLAELLKSQRKHARVQFLVTSSRVMVELARRAGNRGLAVLGYGRHIKPELAAAARDAGCDLVAPRSEVIGDLQGVIERALGAASAVALGRRKRSRCYTPEAERAVHGNVARL